MTATLWKKGKYLEAYSYGPITVEGHLYKGLALRKVANASIKTGSLPTYCLTHCGTGHRVLRIIARCAMAFKIATEIADAGDWSFTSLDGWKNQFPDAHKKLKALGNKFPHNVIFIKTNTQSEIIAKAVAMANI